MPTWPAPTAPPDAALDALRQAVERCDFPSGEGDDEWSGLVATARARLGWFLHHGVPPEVPRRPPAEAPGPAVAAAVDAWSKRQFVPALTALRAAVAAHPDDVEAVHTLAAAEVAWRNASEYRPWDVGAPELDPGYARRALRASVDAAADRLDAWGASPLARVLRAQVAWRDEDAEARVTAALLADAVIDDLDGELLALADDVLSARGWPDLSGQAVTVTALRSDVLERCGPRLIRALGRASPLDPASFAAAVLGMRAAVGHGEPPPIDLHALAAWMATTKAKSPLRTFGIRAATSAAFEAWFEAKEGLTDAVVAALAEAPGDLPALPDRIRALHARELAEAQAALAAIKARHAAEDEARRARKAAEEQDRLDRAERMRRMERNTNLFIAFTLALMLAIAAGLRLGILR